jgi:hypothetical protein
MKTWGCGGAAPTFLTSAVDVGEWLASVSGRFTPEERVPVTHWIGSWVGLMAFLDAVPLPPSRKPVPVRT